MGDNIEAAYDAGINIKRHKIINFTICSTMAAVAGILLSMRLGTAEPNAGRIWELWTIIAVVLGGTRLSGGFGSMWMTLGGVLTLAVIRNGLRLLNTPNYVELMVMGAVLILALALDRLLAHGGNEGMSETVLSVSGITKTVPGRDRRSILSASTSAPARCMPSSARTAQASRR